MKIRNKIILYSFIWLICILMCVNFLVYFMFIRIATNNASDTLQRRAEHILSELGSEGVLRPNTEDWFARYLPENSMIRVLDANADVVNLIFNRMETAIIKPKLVQSFSSELDKTGNHRILVVRLPILHKDKLVGTLEIAEILIALENNISILISILFTATVGAIVLALFGAITLSRFILEPISKLIYTMKDIEESLTFKKIPLPESPKDELYAMTNTFNRMMERIEASFARQKQFVSDASHELKTSITIIESYANLLRRWGYQNLELQKEAVETIHSESIRMKKMTQQLLDLASLEKGHDFNPERFDMVAFSRKIARLIQKIYKRPIHVLAKAQAVDVYADKMKVKQLLLILLDNALKYSNEAIEIRLWKHEDIAYTQVKDNGVGIPEDEINHVFERFYRVDKARTRKSGGTGLGLSIAKSIVLEHGGTIEVDSEIGKGTAFTFSLPTEKVQWIVNDEGVAREEDEL